MRIKEGYMLRETGDSRMVVACEPNAGSFRGMIRLNQSAAMLYRMLEQGATEDQLTDALLRTYRVDEPRARTDVVAFLDLLAETGLLTD